ncbi:MAG TPA: polymer-forming cytoskeletal protein [Candidatus Hydrogenedentes bacterium]|nr:polymer-forming cytoskeletal protein [Candidatus Hydrogenedentota bacterium]HIJ72571.1 polymer-forming cytoskeletal protein [Candidatus Hydrogenedentota bacterium]
MTQQETHKDDPPVKKPLKLNFDELDKGTGDTFDELEKASKGGSVFRRFNAAFQDVLQSSRGGDRSVHEEDDPRVSADDLAIRRAKSVSTKRMIVPEGVIISGSMTSGSETEISGRVDGDVTVDGRLHLGPTALVSGNVRAAFCKVEGLVEGNVQCSQVLELGQTGRLNADALAGKRVTLAGKVFGNVTTSGALCLLPTARVTGNIRTKRLVLQEGAIFNGECAMRSPAEKRSEL